MASAALPESSGQGVPRSGWPPESLGMETQLTEKNGQGASVARAPQLAPETALEQLKENPNPGRVPPLPLIITKVVARCNLNCTYCYEFNLLDQSWRNSATVMSSEVFDLLLRRVRQHCEWSQQSKVNFSFHGGEPCILGPKRFSTMCARAREALPGVEVKISLQTNGTLLNGEWASVLRDTAANVGISLDGPKAINDKLRVDHKGHGSYDRVLRGIESLKKAGVDFGLLTVIQLGADPLAVHRHFLSLGCNSLSYLMPDFTHDTFGDTHRRHGPSPCADFLIPIFDDWWFNSTIDVRIRNFWDIGRMIMGGNTHVDALGNAPLSFVVVNTSGDIEGLDVLKACEDSLVKTGLNIRDSDFIDIARTSPLHAGMIFNSMPLPEVCRACQECETCGGGYHPHRYSRNRGFDNPSVWCADLLRLFTHIRARLGVSVAETRERKLALREDREFQEVSP